MLMYQDPNLRLADKPSYIQYPNKIGAAVPTAEKWTGNVTGEEQTGQGQRAEDVEQKSTSIFDAKNCVIWVRIYRNQWNQ